MRITKDMTIQTVVETYPETIPVFSRHGIACLDCSAAEYDSVEQGALVHDVDTDQLVRELNACLRPLL